LNTLCPRTTSSPSVGREQLDALLDLGPGDLDVDPPDTLADRAGDRREALLVEGRHRRGLGQPVALEHLRVVQLVELLEHGLGQGGAPGQRALERGALLAALGCLDQADVHGGDAHEDRALLVHEQVECGRPVEARQHHHGGAHVERGVHAAGLPEGVEQRQAAEHDVGLVDVEAALGRHDDVHGHVEMGDFGALGLAGGPAGVEHHRRVVGVARHDRLDPLRRGGQLVEALHRRVPAVHHGQHRYAGELGALHALAEQGRGADQRPGPRVGQDVLDLLGLEERVDGHGDAAERQHAEVGQREVVGVGQQ